MPRPRSALTITWEKSWHTPSRRSITWMTGVEIVVTPERKRKSCKSAGSGRTKPPAPAGRGERRGGIIAWLPPRPAPSGCRSETPPPVPPASGVAASTTSSQAGVLPAVGRVPAIDHDDSAVTSKSACGRSRNSQVTMVAEMIFPSRRRAGLRLGDDAFGDHRLPRQRARPQMHHMRGEFDRAAIGVAADVRTRYFMASGIPTVRRHVA